MATYKLTSTVTARTQNGNDAGKIPASVPPFESNTTRIIRETLHRKIESGQYLNLYVPDINCVKVTTPPPIDPPPVETSERIQIRYSQDGGNTWGVWREFEEVI